MTIRPIGIIWLAVGCLCGACGSSSHSPTEPGTRSVPKISNLDNPAQATLLPGPTIDGQRPGVLPVTFNFTDPGGNLNTYTLTLPSGGVTNRLQGVSGETSGATGVQQSLLLPASGTRVTYTLAVTDASGTSSNTLTGSFVSP
jgi:hypothetical protein